MKEILFIWNIGCCLKFFSFGFWSHHHHIPTFHNMLIDFSEHPNPSDWASGRKLSHVKNISLSLIIWETESCRKHQECSKKSLRTCWKKYYKIVHSRIRPKNFFKKNVNFFKCLIQSCCDTDREVWKIERIHDYRLNRNLWKSI